MEYVLAFGNPRHFNAAAVATPLKYRTGGRFRQRGKDGQRKLGSAYPTHTTRRTAPNLVHIPVGGGLLGHALAHENEAPYPIGVPTHFIRACCPPGGIVLDPFAGSGTTAHAAQNEGRRWLAFDLRQSQCDLTHRRLATVAQTDTRQTLEI